MFIKKSVVSLAVLISMSSLASAKWGVGLGKENKTIFVPSQQQSGWRVKDEGCCGSCCMAPKKEEPKKVEKVVAAQPVDSDHDGVFDQDDTCPNTPAGTKVDGRGCPVVEKPAPTPTPEPAKVVPEKEWVLTGVLFETGSDKLKGSSEASLNEAAEILKSHPRVQVEVQGHTDNVGKPASNQALSEKRAVSVKNYLIGKGIAAARLQTKGYGESHPIADNKTEEGRSKNRRIEFKVLSR